MLHLSKVPHGIVAAALLAAGVTAFAPAPASAGETSIKPITSDTYEVIPGVTIDLKGSIFQKTEPQKLVNKNGETVFLFFSGDGTSGQAQNAGVQRFDRDGDLVHLSLRDENGFGYDPKKGPARIDRTDDGYVFEYMTDGKRIDFYQGAGLVTYGLDGNAVAKFYSDGIINHDIPEEKVSYFKSMKESIDEVARQAIERHRAQQQKETTADASSTSGPQAGLVAPMLDAQESMRSFKGKLATLRNNSSTFTASPTLS